MKAIKNLRKDNGGFGLTGLIVSLVIISVMITEALPYLSGINKLKQAKSAINTANSVINAEIQYQQASYSNYAEKNSAPSPSGGDYFGTVSQMISGMDILPDNNFQQFLSQGLSLSVVNYMGNGNCIDEQLGGNVITECLKDESNGQFELVINGLNAPTLSPYISMFENGIKGGVSAYSGGVLSAQVSVPFGFSAYPKIQNGGGSTAAATAASGGGGGGSTGPTCTISNGAGTCVQWTYPNGASTTDLMSVISHPGQECIETDGAGVCVAWAP